MSRFLLQENLIKINRLKFYIKNIDFLTAHRQFYKISWTFLETPQRYPPRNSREKVEEEKTEVDD